MTRARSRAIRREGQCDADSASIDESLREKPAEITPVTDAAVRNAVLLEEALEAGADSGQESPRAAGFQDSDPCATTCDGRGEQYNRGGALRYSILLTLRQRGGAAEEPECQGTFCGTTVIHALLHTLT